MMDCFVPTQGNKFELALQEELPEAYDAIQKLLAESSIEKFFTNLYVVMVVVSLYSDVYDKQGREGLRKLREKHVSVDPAHENAHDDLTVSVNIDAVRGS